MDDLLIGLTELITSIESRQEQESEHGIADNIELFLSKQIEIGEELPLPVVAELLAFSFVEDYQDKTVEWETYYGPMIVTRDANGQSFESPSINLVTPEIINYWEQRAQDSLHPLMRTRYADLVWNFSRKIRGTSPQIMIAHIIIDETIKVAGQNLCKYESSTITKLRRALTIALSTRDQVRISSLVDAIIAYEDTVAKDSTVGLWGFSFDLLVENKNVPLSSDKSTKIINDLEARLQRAANPQDGGQVDDFAAEITSNRLARFYRRKGSNADVERVLRLYSDAVLKTVIIDKALVASSKLQKVYDVFQKNNMKDDADNIALRLNEVNKQTVNEMKVVSTQFDISREELEEYLTALTEGSLTETLYRVAIEFLPDKEKNAIQVQELAQKAAFQSLVIPICYGASPLMASMIKG